MDNRVRAFINALRGNGVSAQTQAAIQKLDAQDAPQPIAPPETQQPPQPQMPIYGGPTPPEDLMKRVQALEAQRQAQEQERLKQILIERQKFIQQNQQPQAPDPYSQQFTQGVRPLQ